jgi:hypothetical protein
MSEGCVAEDISTYRLCFESEARQGFYKVNLFNKLFSSYQYNSVYGHKSSHPNLLIIKIRFQWPFI